MFVRPEKACALKVAKLICGEDIKLNQHKFHYQTALFMIYSRKCRKMSTGKCSTGRSWASWRDVWVALSFSSLLSVGLCRSHWHWWSSGHAAKCFRIYCSRQRDESNSIAQSLRFPSTGFGNEDYYILFQYMFNVVVQAANLFRARGTEHRVFKVVCRGCWSDRTDILLRIEPRWLPTGIFLTLFNTSIFNWRFSAWRGIKCVSLSIDSNFVISQGTGMTILETEEKFPNFSQ